MNQIEHYSSLPFYPINDGRCDVIVEKPTYFMKLDAGNILVSFCEKLKYFMNKFAVIA